MAEILESTKRMIMSPRSIDRGDGVQTLAPPDEVRLEKKDYGNAALLSFGWVRDGALEFSISIPMDGRRASELLHAVAEWAGDDVS